MYVTKSDGRREKLDMSKFKKQIHFTTMGTDIDPLEFERKIHLFLTDGIKTSDLQHVIISTATNNASVEEPDWVKVAGRAAMWNLCGLVYKKTKFNTNQWKDHIEYLVSEGYYKKLIIDKLNKFNVKNEDIDVGTLQHVKPLNTDFDKVISSVLSLEEKYMIKDIEGNILEYPFMIHIANAAILADTRKRFFKLLKAFLNGDISLATPFLRNLRRPNGNTGSCFIGATPDNLAGIMKMLSDMSFISKEGGGIGWYIGKIRHGNIASKRIAKSNKITKWSKLVNDIAIAVDQAGVRKAGITIGYDWWQMDIGEFMEMKSELTGDLRDKTFDIFPQIVIDEYFVDAVIDNKEVYLFSNYEFYNITKKDPTDYVDEELYNIHLEAKELIESGQLKHYKKVNAREMWDKMLWLWFEVGEIYITHKDMLNFSNVLKHDDENYAIAYTANLCVTGDTKLLTKEYGYRPIGEMVESGIDKVTAWNGEEWSETPIFRTDDGNGQNVIRVTLYSGEVIDATYYHKWYVYDPSDKSNRRILEKRTHELKPNDKIEKFKLPNSVEIIDKEVLNIQKLHGKQPTYCGTEPKRNKLVFNGVLTGNCVESYSVNIIPNNWKEEVKDGVRTTTETDGMYHSCNLLSINLANMIHADEDKIKETSDLAVYIMDKSVDLGSSPVKEAEIGINALRNVGIGFIGKADYMAYHNMMYDTLEGRKFGTAIIEKFAWHIYNASVELAKEFGSYPMYKASNYKTLFGRDTKELVNISKNFTGNNYDWEDMRQRIIKHGIRNFLLLAIAPNTSTGPLMGVNPSYLPAFNKFNYETLMSFNTPVVCKFLKDKYWAYKTRFQYKVEDIVEYTATIQTFIDTGISMELNMNIDEVDVSKLSNAFIKNFKLKRLKGIYYSKSVNGCTDCAN